MKADFLLKRMVKYSTIKAASFLIAGVLIFSCGQGNEVRDTENVIESLSAISGRKMQLLLQEAGNVPDKFPRTYSDGKLITSGMGGWTSGFFPGCLWYTYQLSGDEHFKEAAKTWTGKLEELKAIDWQTHDLGFMVFNSFGNGMHIMPESNYKEIILQTSDSLVLLFNPQVGTMLSWPFKWAKEKWDHNTIIDNLMNLEMLLWAAKNGRPHYMDLVKSHLDTTMKYHIREDFTTYHLANYNSSTGEFLGGHTYQGFSDSSTWARGQAWAVYGFTMAYRELRDPRYLETAKKLADVFIANLPEDKIPYWDFDRSGFENEPKDVSAAMIFLSAYISLTKELPEKWHQVHGDLVTDMLKSVSENYLASEKVPFILDHATGHRPASSEVDVPLIYADYYLLESLLKLKNAL